MLGHHQRVHLRIGHGAVQLFLPLHLLQLHRLAFQLLVPIVHDKLLDELVLGGSGLLLQYRPLLGQSLFLFVQRLLLDNHFFELQAGITVQVVLFRFEGRAGLFGQDAFEVDAAQQGQLDEFAQRTDSGTGMDD